jgi:RecB family endonuclease NucS
MLTEYADVEASEKPAVALTFTLERVLQHRVKLVLDRIEPDLRCLKESFGIRSSAGRRRVIDLLCEDARGNSVVIEFKRCGVTAREVVAQIVEYMGMRLAAGVTDVRGYIVVGDRSPELYNAERIVRGLRICTYQEIFPEALAAPQKQ